MGTIHGFCSDFDGLSIILSISTTLLAVLLLAMTMFRNDKHLEYSSPCTKSQLKVTRMKCWAVDEEMET